LHTSKKKSTLILAGLVIATAATSFAATASSAAGRHTKDTGAGAQATLDRQLALARNATVKYVTNLGLAKRSGYRIITHDVPGVGYRFMNAAVRGFDVRKPAILVYERRGSGWQLGAVEWVLTSKPTEPPLPGASYGSFRAGCQYTDGTFAPSDDRAGCPASAPRTGAAFRFWHRRLVTLNVWLWSANPNGLFASTNPASEYENPLVAAYSGG
jgi:hypothetical protein